MAQLKSGSTVGGQTIATVAQVQAVSVENLEKSFTVATGGSTTNRRVVMVNTSGQVGLYPTAPQTNSPTFNTTASLLQNHDGQAYQYTGGTSMYRVYQTGTGQTQRYDQLYGVYYPGSSAPVVGNAVGTNMAVSSGYTQNRQNSSECYGTRNGLVYMHRIGAHNTFYDESGSGFQGQGQSHTRSYTVNTSGQLTAGQVVSSNLNRGGGSAGWIGNGCTGKRIGEDVFGMINVGWVNYSNYQQGSYHAYVMRIQGGTVVSNVGVQHSQWQGLPSAKHSCITGGNIFVSATNNLKYTSPWSSNWPSSVSSAPWANEITDHGTSLAYNFLDNTKFMMSYLTPAGSSKLGVYSINNTTGAMTLIDEMNTEERITQVIPYDATKVCLAYGNGYNTIALNSNGTIIGLGNKISAPGGSKGLYAKSTTSLYVAIHIDGVSHGNKGVTISATKWSDLQWNAVGISNGTYSAGQTASVIHQGFVDGYTGLTPGEWYYIDLDNQNGTITTASGNIGYRVGRAISSTTIKLDGELG